MTIRGGGGTSTAVMAPTATAATATPDGVQLMHRAGKGLGGGGAGLTGGRPGRERAALSPLLRLPLWGIGSRRLHAVAVDRGGRRSSTAFPSSRCGVERVVVEERFPKIAREGPLKPARGTHFRQLRHPRGKRGGGGGKGRGRRGHPDHRRPCRGGTTMQMQHKVHFIALDTQRGGERRGRGRRVTRLFLLFHGFFFVLVECRAGHHGRAWGGASRGGRLAFRGRGRGDGLRYGGKRERQGHRHTGNVRRHKRRNAGGEQKVLTAELGRAGDGRGHRRRRGGGGGEGQRGDRHRGGGGGASGSTRPECALLLVVLPIARRVVVP